MEDINLSTYVVAGALPALLLFYNWIKADNLRWIPAIGPSFPILSYIGAYRFMHHAYEMVQEGYNKYKGGVFKVAMPDRWLVLVTGHDLVDDLRKAPDDTLSFTEGAGDLAATKYTFPAMLHDDPYHITVIRQQLTRHLTSLFADVQDEIHHAFEELIPTKGNEWVSVPVMPTMRQIVARASNRVFVGVPTCRNSDYLKLAINFTLDVSRARKKLNWVPPAFKTFANYFVSTMASNTREGMKHLQPVINERLQALEENGEEWPDKPNDMLMWLMDEARSRKQNMEMVVSMMLVVNFAAIHTSSNSFSHALYHLAANPEYAIPLREEIDTVIGKEGWTKLAMGKMRKLDSFFRESQRVNGLNCISVFRKALKDFTFSDGTKIPAGTLVVAASTATHLDEENYPNAEVFNPWRFSDIRDETEAESLKHQFVSTSVDYVPFGHGKHACPGRFFAANELKAMMAHILLNYDVKFEQEGVRPANQWYGFSVIPAPTAKVLFRKRLI